MSTAFLYTNNDEVEFEIKNTIPFTLAPTKPKILNINLTNYVRYLYVEKYKTLINEIKAELNKWRHAALFMDRKTQYSQDISSSQLKLYIQCNSNQNPSKLFMDINKLILEFTWRG